MNPSIAAASTAFLILFAAPAAWSGYDEGVAAYQREEYGQALLEFHPLAERGHAEAQFMLGVMYEMGWGVDRNSAVAARWYRRAADQGFDFAQESLALMYRSGQGVSQDFGEALKWFRRAAEQGRTSAQNSLGFMYSKGWGVPQDNVQAYKWYSIAASAKADEYGAKASRNREIVAKRMTPAELSKARRLAREWSRTRRGPTE